MTVGVMSQLAVLVSMVMGALFLNDRITATAALGSILTIGGVVGVTWVTSMRGTREPVAIAASSAG